MVGRTYLERGAPVVLVARWSGAGPRNVLVRRADGRLVVRPFRGLRRLRRESPLREEAGQPAARVACERTTRQRPSSRS